MYIACMDAILFDIVSSYCSQTKQITNHMMRLVQLYNAYITIVSSYIQCLLSREIKRLPIQSMFLIYTGNLNHLFFLFIYKMFTLLCNPIF